MKPARLILLVVALVAGGLAAVFALNRSPSPEPQIAEVEAKPVTKVLVASQTIGVGQRVLPDMFEWQEWPLEAIRSEFITSDTLPDAPEQLTNAVARFEIFVGDPIRLAKLVQSNSGYLSAVIGPGMRGVSVSVTPETGAGGFIVPNDRVDVIVTRRTQMGDVSETILTNVRVIAMGKRIGEQGDTGAAPTDETAIEEKTIATLELSPTQAETLVNGRKAGEVSLTLRSIADFASNGAQGSTGKKPAVQLISGGKVFTTQINLPEQQSDAGEATELPMPQLVQTNAQTSTQSQSNLNSSASGQSAAPVLE